MQRRSAALAAAYLAIVLVHLVLLAADHPAARWTKWLLMPVLLAVVVLASTRPANLWAGPQRRGLALLAVAITASWAGDVLLGVSFVVGLAAFAAAHVAYLALFLGPARARRPHPWAAAGYLVWIAVLMPVLWPHLDELALAVAAYAVLLAATATAATGVNGTTGVGGLLFLASDSLLAFRIFYPDFTDLFPDPWQDLTIMALYCAGQGLMALGVLRRLQVRAAEQQPGRVAPVTTGPPANENVHQRSTQNP